MSNLEQIATTLADYRRNVIDAAVKRDRELERLQKYEGDVAEAEREEIRKSYEKRVDELQKSARKKALESARRCAANAEKVIPAAVPTSEELRVLELIRMRESMGKSELDSLAATITTPGARAAFLEISRQKWPLPVSFPNCTASATDGDARKAVAELFSVISAQIAVTDTTQHINDRVVEQGQAGAPVDWTLWRNANNRVTTRDELLTAIVPVGADAEFVGEILDG